MSSIVGRGLKASGIRIWSDTWKEQGYSQFSYYCVSSYNLVKPFSDTTYFVTVGVLIPGIVGQNPNIKTTTSFSIRYDVSWWYNSWWIAMGY